MVQFRYYSPFLEEPEAARLAWMMNRPATIMIHHFNTIHHVQPIHQFDQ
jgi:hypothetical protein